MKKTQDHYQDRLGDPDSRGTYLFVWIYVDVALDALLAMVCPRIAGHPLSLALGTLVLAEAALLPLIVPLQGSGRCTDRRIINAPTTTVRVTAGRTFRAALSRLDRIQPHPSSPKARSRQRTGKCAH
uniref:Uncharacterized protein n=1 Tax=Anopheles culicifacies TaxID=139723 RepID=A0A182MEJ1_9DIPT